MLNLCNLSLTFESSCRALCLYCRTWKLDYFESCTKMYTLDKVEPVHLTHNSADISALFKRNTLSETRFSIKRFPPLRLQRWLWKVRSFLIPSGQQQRFQNDDRNFVQSSWKAAKIVLCCNLWLTAWIRWVWPEVCFIAAGTTPNGDVMVYDSPWSNLYITEAKLGDGRYSHELCLMQRYVWSHP